MPPASSLGRRNREEEAGTADPVELLIALVDRFRAIQGCYARSTPWASLELTMGQLKAVMLLVESGGTPTNGLAERLGIVRSAITPLVDKLVAQKLVRREPDPGDRRVVWIRPTPKAAALRQALLETRRPVLQMVWDAVAAQDRAAVRVSLERLLESAEQVLARPTAGVTTRTKSRVK
jgi:DNA-binding MarR family transcriptional regulator